MLAFFDEWKKTTQTVICGAVNKSVIVEWKRAFADTPIRSRRSHAGQTRPAWPRGHEMCETKQEFMSYFIASVIGSQRSRLR